MSRTQMVSNGAMSLMRSLDGDTGGIKDSMVFTGGDFFIEAGTHV